MLGGQQKVHFIKLEIGLQGSKYYVNDLKTNAPLELKAHKLNIDIDMIASPNYVRGVWEADHRTKTILKTKMATIHNVFKDYFEQKGLPTNPFEFNGRSDFQAFIDNDIPAGGVITGEDEIKSAAEAELFGGVPGMVLDRINI